MLKMVHRKRGSRTRKNQKGRINCLMGMAVDVQHSMQTGKRQGGFKNMWQDALGDLFFS